MAKLTNEQKIEIYERRQNGETISSLSKIFLINDSNIKYLISLIRIHGYNILRNGKKYHYSKELKVEMIEKVLLQHHSINSVSLQYGLSSPGLLKNWITKYIKNGYNVIEKPKERKKKTMTTIKKKTTKQLTESEKLKELEKENLYLRAENEYLKKLNALVQERELPKKKK